MKRTLLATAVSVALSVAAIAPAMAASDEMTPAPPMNEQAATTGTSINAGELVGKNITNTHGEAIGEVTSIVRDSTSNDPYAVVSVGGILGFGDKKVTIPLQEMQMQQDTLSAPLAATEDELKTRPAFDEARYTGVDDAELVQVGIQGDMPATGTAAPLGGEMAAEPIAPPPGTAAETSGFGSLDANQDGYVSKDEATVDQGISENWERVDTNGDNRLDQSEFSAFEPTGMSSPSDTMRPMTEPGGMMEGTGEGLAPAAPTSDRMMK